MANLGKATAYIKIYDTLPGVTSNVYRDSFDLPSDNMKLILGDGKIKTKEPEPVEVDFIEDNGKTYMLPTRICKEINNCMSKNQEASDRYPRLEWSPTVSLCDFWKDYLKISSVVYPNNVAPTPIWNTGVVNKVFNKTNNEKVTASTKEKKLFNIEQTNCEPDIFWGIQSSPKFGNNMPFYINIRKKMSKSINLPDFFLIRINPAQVKKANSFDILVYDSRIFVVDWIIEKTNTTTTTKAYFEPEIYETGLTCDMNRIRIGVFPCLGKLAIFSEDINTKKAFFYTRIKNVKITDDDASNKSAAEYETVTGYFKVQADTIEVFGSNAKAEIDLAAMCFNKSTLFPPIYGAKNTQDGEANQAWSYTKDGKTGIAGTDYFYCPGGDKGVSNSGIFCKKYNGNDFVLPKINAANNTFGEYGDAHGEITANFNTTSQVYETAKILKIEIIPEKLVRADDTSNSTFFTDSKKDEDELYSGTALVFRLKGMSAPTPPSTSSNTPTTYYDVISMSETFSSQSTSNLEHSVDLVLYNPDGKFNFLKEKSKGIQVFLSLSNEDGDTPVQTPSATPVFTGITFNTIISEMPGKETISIHCQDYMRILEDTQFINSPFYDGMDAFDVIYDIGKRCGINTITDNTDQNKRFYCKAGYNFQQPVLKPQYQSKYKDTMIEVAKMATRVVYFNASGELIWDQLQGSLDFDIGRIGTIKYEFFRDPSKFSKNGEVRQTVIIGEKRYEKLISEVLNQIDVVTVERETNERRFITYSAEKLNKENKMPYRKKLIYDQAAFGGVPAAVDWVKRNAERFFKVPSKISFKTITADTILPLTFIKVDGLKFRVSGFTRNYSAEDNSLTTDISAEWWGSEESQG